MFQSFFVDDILGGKNTMFELFFLGINIPASKTLLCILLCLIAYLLLKRARNWFLKKGLLFIAGWFLKEVLHIENRLTRHAYSEFERIDRAIKVTIGLTLSRFGTIL